MDILDLVILGSVIAANNLSFAFGMGALGTNTYHLRIVLIFTIVEFTIPLVGLFIGQFLSSFVKNYADLIGGIILVSLGLYTIITSFKTKKERKESLDYITSVKGLLLIALGLSTDNLLVGFSLGLGNVNPLQLAFFIGLFSMVFTFVGLKTGKYIKQAYGKYVQIFAGILLMVLGIINYIGY